MSRVVTIGLAEVIAKVDGLAKDLAKPGDLMMIAARAVGNELKTHFLAKNSQGNKQGFPSQGFWAQVRDSVQSLRGDSNSAIVQINDPRFNLHYFGGTVTPKESKALTIPVNPAAYGLRAAMFEDLVAITFKSPHGNSIGLLGRKTGPGEALEVYYVLVKSATIPKDPDALPADKLLEDSASKVIEMYLQNLVGGS